MVKVMPTLTSSGSNQLNRPVQFLHKLLMHTLNSPTHTHQSMLTLVHVNPAIMVVLSDMTLLPNIRSDGYVVYYFIS